MSKIMFPLHTTPLTSHEDVPTAIFALVVVVSAIPLSGIFNVQRKVWHSHA